MTQTNEIDKKYSYGKIWKIAYPILISLVMEQLIGMTDTAFLGRVGEIEIGASASVCRSSLEGETAKVVTDWQARPSGRDCISFWGLPSL